MLTTFIKFGDGTISTETDASTLAAALRDPRCVFWVDMVKPTDEEYGLLDDVFGFHPLAIEDTLASVQRPKIESYNHTGDSCQQGYFYMVIHGPDLATFREHLRTKELDMFVSERYLVTIHEEEMLSVKQVMQRATYDARRVLDPGIDLLLHNILDHLVDHYGPILDYLGEALDELEDEAADNPKPDLLQRIAAKKRELLELRRVIGPQREVIAQLTRGDVPFIRESTRVYLRDVLDHLNRAVENLELYRDVVLGVRDIYMSSISNNLNQIMKTLTIITVIALPMTVITSFFGMNFNDERIPVWSWLLHSTVGFWLSMCVIVGLIAGLLYVFRRLKWL
ncbi:MAG TPA: magnesium/cobalt transporter CorA [Tepidisphaeraceae bacterium]|nr:magnesium/cobalt transporter CorA [Tepidisphaeraceae bacterium]